MVHEKYPWSVRLVALLGCLALVLLGCSQDPEATKQKHFSRGEKYLSQEKVDEAIIEFKNALQADPKFADGHYRLAVSYERKGWLHDARWEYRKTLEIQSAHTQAQLDLASLDLEVGLVKEALDLANAVIGRDAQSARAHALAGRALILSRDFAKARVRLQRALELNPRLALTHYALGTLAAAENKSQEADQAFRKAIELDPKYVEPYLALGFLAAAAAHQDEAEKAFLTAIQIRPGSIPARVSLAALYGAQRKYDEGIKQLEAVAGARVPDIRVAIPLAGLYNLTGKFDKAVSLLSPVTKLFPSLAQGHYLMGEAYLALNKPGKRPGTPSGSCKTSPRCPCSEIPTRPGLCGDGEFQSGYCRT